jgi:hypothetical protein
MRRHNGYTEPFRLVDGQQRGCTPTSALRQWLRQAARTLGQILYGMTIYDMVRDLRRERAEVERLFVVVTYGELLGVPILPTYYNLRLLPFVVPRLALWRRSLLRERDLSDLCRDELT